jgi:hypothetical protein
MNEQEEFTLAFMKDLENQKKLGKNGFFKINEKVSDSNVFYLKAYLQKNYPAYRVETRKCVSCLNTWDILIFF